MKAEDAASYRGPLSYHISQGIHFFLPVTKLCFLRWKAFECSCQMWQTEKTDFPPDTELLCRRTLDPPRWSAPLPARQSNTFRCQNEKLTKDIVNITARVQANHAPKNVCCGDLYFWRPKLTEEGTISLHSCKKATCLQDAAILHVGQNLLQDLCKQEVPKTSAFRCNTRCSHNYNNGDWFYVYLIEHYCPLYLSCCLCSPNSGFTTHTV